MKNTRYILLVIGLLGIASGVYELLKGHDTINYLTGLICGASLMLGYFELGKQKDNKA